MNAPVRLGAGDSRTGTGPLRVLVGAASLVERRVIERIVRQAGLSVSAVNPDSTDIAEIVETGCMDALIWCHDAPSISDELGALLRRIVASAGEVRVILLAGRELVAACHADPPAKAANFSVLAKPCSGHFDRAYAEALLDALLGRRPVAVPAADASTDGPTPHMLRPMGRGLRAVAIGGSTGGVGAINAILTTLPAQSRVPLFITQHLPANFQPLFVQQLSRICGCKVVEAQDDMVVRPGVVHLAPGHAHIGLHRSGGGPVRIRLDRTPAEHGCCPAVDPMLGAAASVYGPGLCGIVLSGMGRDGQAGARSVVEQGGWIIAQDELTSSVWGMPGAVARAGLASAILPPEGMVPLLMQLGLGQ